MRKGLLTTLMLLTVSSASASEFLEFGAKNFKSTKLKESKWVFDFGANFMAYPTNLPSFEGVHENIKGQENYNLYGLNLGFGRELYLGAGLSTTIKVNGLYSKTLDRTVGQASEDVDIELANTSSDHMMMSGEASASINYLFETKSIGIQPFVEFALGTGQATIQREYEYRGLEGGINPNPELYDIRMDEDFNYARSTVGINFISATGLVFYTKASRLGMVVTEREYTGKIQEAGAKSSTNQNDKKTNLNESNEVMMYSLGMGFMF